MNLKEYWRRPENWERFVEIKFLVATEKKPRLDILKNLGYSYAL
jgi:hypothetical protein